MPRRPAKALLAAQRAASTVPLSPTQGHALAGILDAEGSFSIQRQNRGQSWTCPVALSMRDDDARLVQSLHEVTGIGSLTAVPARNTSRPQVAWVVRGKLECEVLADIIEKYPLRGRKRHEADLWTRAVRLWSAERCAHGSRADLEIGRLSDSLTAHRVYREPVDDDDLVPILDEAFLSYFGGFFSGEGCFLLRDKSARIAVHVRRDDRPLLMTFARTLGVGRVYNAVTTPPDSPAATWIVMNPNDLGVVIDAFDAGGLHGRKLRQYHAWRPAALEIVRAAREGRARNRETIACAREALREASEYKPEPLSLLLPEREHRERAQEAYVTILRRWAARTKSACLTCTAYQRERAAFWPDRNTVVRFFGSWAAALDAAGLGDRATARARLRAATARAS